MKLTRSARPTLWSAFGLLALQAGAAWAQAQGGAPAAPEAAQRQAAPVAPAAARTNPVTVAAVQQGVLACSGRINQVVNYLGVDEQAGGLLMLPAGPADQRLVPFAFEVPTPSGSAYVAASFAPNQANGCGASYDAVVYWPQRCDEVAQQRFGAFKRTGSLKKDIAVLDGGPATKVFLLPAGSGCVSIKKELVL